WPMMGYRKLCLLLLLSSYTLAGKIKFEFKAYKKYVYQYTTETRNGMVGAANLGNGPKVSCQVEIEIPQTCRFIMRTRDCVLSEVSIMDPQDQPIYRHSPSSHAFQSAMEKNPLKFTVQDITSVHLYPETDEPVNILNIKRGIVSTLIVPVMEDEQNSIMSTVHGQCLTDHLVNGKNIATDVTVSRDLSQCDQFYRRESANSPLALLQTLHHPMSKLITSTQDCNYQFDNKGKHIMAAMCTEKHIYKPFSHEDNGISSVVTQELSFQSSKRTNNRLFGSQSKPLHFEDPDNKAPVQTKDTVLSSLRDLVALAGTDWGQKRTSLFHKLVSSLRVLRNETLSQTVTEMIDTSGWLTYQALLQCGTPECTSAILQAIRTIDGVSLQVDALVYGLSLWANPDAVRVRDMLSMAQYKQSKAIMYALANTTTPLWEFFGFTDKSVLIRESGSGLQCPKLILFSNLQVVGVMGPAMQVVSPSLISSILRCAQKTDIPLSNQKAAIQAFSYVSFGQPQVRNVLMEVYQDTQSSLEKRIAAYLILMKNPHQTLVQDIVNNLENVRNEQLKSFVISHLNNIRNFDKPQILREHIELALKKAKGVFDGMSQNYKINSPLGSVQSNIIFDGSDTLPKEVMLETTLKVFDYNYDIFEVSVEGRGFEPTIDALFGERGFFPDSISRVMYWAGDKAQMLRDVLNRITPDRDRIKRELMDDVHFSQAPEAIAYLRLLGNEIGYLKTSEMRKMALLSLISSTENEVFAHYIFMESAFSLPTASGFPLKFSLAGVFAPGAKGGLTHSGPNIMTDLSFMPSVGLEFITQMGVHIPAFVEAGLEMHTNMYHESSINAKITMNRHQLRLSIPAPKSNTQLLSVSNKLLSVFSGQTKIVPSLVEDHTDSTGCQSLFSGLKLCTILRYSNGTSIYQAPYYPLTGETRFAVEIQPTGEISEYTATITDETLREGKKGRHKVQSLKLTLKAEGDNSTEATASLKYNHNKNILTAEVAIPDYDVEAGIKLALTDSDAKGKKMRGITIDVTNRNIPQLTLVGRTRYIETHFVPSISNIFNREKRFKTFIHYFWVHLDFFTGDDKFELELKSELNSEFQKMIPDGQNYHGQLHQLINDVLDQKVAKTDMKLRHIVTKGIEVSKVGMILIMLLFYLNSDSVFRYQFNKDKMAISLPLPFGGKKLEELNISTTLSIPYINLPEIGLYVPAKNYPLPSITIPPSLDFNIPLLGLAEASTKINSNFYHWEGSISGGNNTFDFPSYILQYKAMAQSPLNLLSYKLEGKRVLEILTTDDNLKYLLNSSFSHSLIDTSFSVLETLRVTDKLNAKANYKIEASSPVGLQASIYYSAQSTSTLNSNEVSGDGTMNGLFNIGSFYTNTSFTHSYNLHPLDQVGRGESTLHFDSPFIQVHNMIHGVYTNSEMNIVSKTNAQRDILKHVAELKYKDAKLTLKCHAIATGMGKALNNKVELGVSRHMAILTIESQADDDANRAYSLITGSLDSNGLELNSEASLTFDTGRGLHKASVMVGRNGLTTSGINSILCSSVTVENIFNGTIDKIGASMSSMTKAIAEESRGELNIEGKVTAAEASLYGVLKGHAYNATTRNNINIALNHRALTFTSNTMGTLKQMKTENSHTLTLTLWTLALHSKTNNFICEDIYYKQDTNVDMKPFVMSLYMTNDLKFYDVSLNNNGHMTLKPLKVDLSGSMKGAYGEEHVYEHIIHTYELTYDDMAGTMKYNMSGDVFGAKLSHNCELQFAGLSSTTNCEAQLKSEPLHFDSTIRTMALPFSFTIDALVNSDGEINLCGKHTGQLYNKLLVKAEPLAFAYSHDSRVSTTHKLPSWEASINVDNKYDGLLAPSDQHLTWTVRSILNDHAYNQDIRTYNNPEKIGFEFSGAILTDIFSKLSKEWRSVPEIQEFSMAGFLKYDKNSDCHIIKIPFIESLPAAFEQLRNTLVKALESFQQFINKLDIDQRIADFRAKLDFLQVQVNNFMQDIDLENNVNQLKAKFDYLIGEFAVTIDDLELVMNNLSKNLENIVMDVATKIRDIILTIKKYLKAGHLTVKITNILSKTGNQLRVFDEKYEIKQSFVKAIHVIEDIIRQIHLQKLTERSTAWLCELDSKYRILDKIRDNLSVIKQAIENFDIDMFIQDVKDYFLSFDLAIHVEQLSYKIPSLEIAKVIESMNDVIVNWIDEYEIPNKLNAVYSYNKDLLLKYKLDDELKELMDQIIILIKELKIEETVQSVVGALKSINFEFFYGKIMQFLHSVTNQLRATDFKKSIDDLNEQISSMLKLMKEFDYSKFVDRTNENIAELTNYINKQIKSYEIVQKIEAVRDFFREIQSSTITYLDELKNTKVADALKKLKNVIDTTFYNDIKMKVQDILEDMRQRIIDMDIRNEIYIHIQRAIESYSNMVAYISVQFNRLIETIRKVVKDSEIITQMKQNVDGALGALKRPDIEVGTFTVPFTDLVIPSFSVNLNKLQEISIPAQISVPEFTIFYFYTIPAFTIDFDEIKAKIVAIIDDIREFKIKMPDLEEIFGDLKVLYLSELPDLTFPEITLSEIKFPAINIPKLNLKDFRITVLPIPEIKLPEVPNNICIPIFGKFHGEFRINFPQYTLVTAGKIENSTSTPKNPQFTATIVSHVQSPVEPLKYTFEATAQLGAPRMKKLLFTETVKAEHMTFSIDHEGFLTLTGSSVEASAKTTTKATTQMYTAHLDNNMALTLKSKISASIDTAYNHNLDIASIETSSQASMKQNIAATMESGTITVTGQTTGNGKWSIKDYSDGGTHTSNVDFNLNLSTAKLIFVGESDCQALKLKQTLTAESVILSHITVEARCETEVPSIKKSVMILNGQTHIGDLKVALTASHDAEFSGSLIGSMSNSLEFMAHPFEIVLNVKNQVNSKIFLPLKLTGKVDLLNDYRVSLNSDKQHACWFALARFNQYKYNHNFTAANNEMDIFFHTSANAEANLDFLTVPVSFPEITVPYIEMKTPAVRHISLWEQAGFKTLLTTPQQSFDMNLKLHYYKNPDMHNNELHLEPIYNAISGNANIIQAQFEQYRDRVVALIKDSYNQAKSQYIKHNTDTSSLPPRIFTVPGYKIPILNIDISAFRAEMPAFSYFVPKEVSTPRFKVPALGFSVPSYTLVVPSLQLPVIHVPETLSEIKLPNLTLPAIQNNIVIPAMGNLTCDFSFKSTVITLNANAGLYNQSDIVARFGASSTSVFDILNAEIDGTASLTRKRGIKLATTVSMEHNNVEANHESAVSINKRSMESSVSNTAKVSLPFLSLELNQELIGNTKTKLNVVSKKKIKYMFNIPLIESVSKGNLNINMALEALSHVSLETSTQGKSDIIIMGGCHFSGDLENEASFYLNADHLHSTKQKRSSNNNILQFDLNKNLALEVSLRRIFATVHYTSNNNIDSASFNTNGRHFIKGELDFVPLTTFKTTLNIDGSQPSSLGHVGLFQSINLAITSEKQSITWSGKEQLASLIHACDLFMSNDESQVCMDLTGSVEGHLAFLKAVRLPVYQKTLWDVFKFDQVTNMDNLQFLNISYSIAYTKAMDGQENTDMRFENVDVPDHLTLPPLISIPAFNLPFTNLHVEPFTIDPKNLHIPKVITTTAYDIMLPGLPIMSVPSYDINTEYLQGKMSFLSFKMPQYEITVSSFTPPKTFTIREHTISLNESTSQILNFELPTSLLSEQTFGIPEMALHLPFSVFIPVFGALSATLNVSSPIYNVSTTANLEKKDSSLVTSLNSICTSTMIFLEYDLSGKTDSLINSQKLILQTSWNRDFLHDMIGATKDRIPAMTNALLKFLNKYHTTHFGFDLNRGSMKLKNTVSNIIERVHHEVLMYFNTMQSSVKHLRDQERYIYRKASDSLMSMSVEDAIDRLAREARQVLKCSEDKIYVFIDAVTKFLSGIKFKVPGSEERLSSLEMFQQTYLSVSRALDRAIQRFASLIDNISRLIRGVEFTIPGTDVAVNGNEIMDKFKFSTRSMNDQLRQSLRRGFGLLQKTVNNLFQLIAEKADNFITYLKHENVEISSQVDVIYAEVLQSSEQHIKETKRHMVEYKDLTKLKIQEAYNALSMECVNNNTKEFISILQSHLFGGLNEGVDIMRRTSQSTAPYIKVTDIEIPLPFLWKSFNEWPIQSRQ
uniref:Apolipoprotein B n=1 Tax=Seriola dumerili TaxID=41447 RepID=A0A3B4VLD7_SERDU